MKHFYLYLLLLLLLTSNSFAQQEVKGASASSVPPMEVIKQKQVLIAPAQQTNDPVIKALNKVKDPSKGYFGRATREEAEKMLRHDKEVLEQHGYEWGPPDEGIPSYVEDTFLMPKNEELSNCAYTTGYTYPGRCFDNKGNVAFDAETDDQAVLDKIIKKQAKQGKYNKMPNGEPIVIKGVEPK